MARVGLPSKQVQIGFSDPAAVRSVLPGRPSDVLKVAPGMDGSLTLLLFRGVFLDDSAAFPFFLALHFTD